MSLVNLHYLEKRKLKRLLKRLGRDCDKLDRYVTEPDEWIIVQAVAWDIIGLTKKVKELKEIFRRTKDF
jgi:hypothetical protein